MSARPAEKDIYDYIAEMKPLIQARDWDGLESRFRAICGQMAGAKQADRIARLAFASYEQALGPLLERSILEAKECDAAAVYFEYDLDNHWDSNFFLCEQYNPESVGDDDWACDWIKDIQGPGFDEAGEIYLENDFDESLLARGSTLYLVARTVAAFGRCVSRAKPSDASICIGFHDQTPITRITEGPEW